MKLTVYNLLMSLLWSDVCVLLFCLLRRRYTFLRDYGFGPLFGLLAVALVRFFLPIELPFTAIIPSYNIMPSMQLILRKTGPLGFSWHGWLAVIWGAVSLMLLFRLLLGIWLQKKRIAAMPSGDSALANLAIQAIMPLGVHWRPTVVVSSSVSVPSVTGFFAPTFLLPELKLTQQQLQEVLRHELGHFLGRDAWIKLGISVFQLVFWWNPLVYLLGKDLNFLLEVRADAYAIGKRSEEEQLDYLEAVTEVIRQLGTNKNGFLTIHTLFREPEPTISSICVCSWPLKKGPAAPEVGDCWQPAWPRCCWHPTPLSCNRAVIRRKQIGILIWIRVALIYS